MANEISKVGGVEKREYNNGDFLYEFSNGTVIKADVNRNQYFVYSRFKGETAPIEFDNITEKYGTTNVVEYLDYICSTGKYNFSVDIGNIYSSSYGEVLVNNISPVVSGNAVYGLIPSNFRKLSIGDGSTGVIGNKISCFSGTSLGTYGAIRSFRSLNYKTGQGALIRFSARFNGVESLTWSGAGAFNLGDEVTFGYNGETFGIWHRYGGLAECEYLTITNPASGAENATVTLNGVAYVIPITSGTAEKNAFEIAAYLDANAPEVNIDQVTNEVRIIYTSDGAKTGGFSFSSTGTATGTFAAVVTGVTKTSIHYPINEWNVSVPENFNPQKGNSYQIEMQNGFGNIKLYIENEQSGNFIHVHTIKWANLNDETNFINPSMHLGIYATALSNITGVNVELAYIAGFINGLEKKTRNPRSQKNTKSITTTLTNLLTVRCREIYNGYSNQVELEPMKITIANDGSKSCEVEIRGNPTVAGTQNFQEVGNNLSSLYDVDGGTVTENGVLLDTYVVAKGQSTTYNLKELEIRQPSGLDITICAKMSSGAAADVSTSLTWYEDI